jgi:hypothetical protein
VELRLAETDPDEMLPEEELSESDALPEAELDDTEIEPDEALPEDALDATELLPDTELSTVLAEDDPETELDVGTGVVVLETDAGKADAAPVIDDDEVADTAEDDEVSNDSDALLDGRVSSADSVAVSISVAKSTDSGSSIEVAISGSSIELSGSGSGVSTGVSIGVSTGVSIGISLATEAEGLVAASSASVSQGNDA